MAHPHQQHASSPGRLTLPVTDLYCVCCAEELEARLRAEPHITRARVGFHSKTVDVEYHAAMIDEPRIRALVDGSRRCACTPGDPASEMTHIGHRAQMAELTLGGDHDHVQFEMASTPAHAMHEMEHGKAASHAGMDHDMSDPRMAKAMEADMRNRFVVALLLTIPTVLYSPLGTDFFNLDLPTGPFNHNWLMLVLSTPVVWWAGWIFIGGRCGRSGIAR